ncbi:DUF4255 domain-containing protein [Sphingomonas sp. BGYR3]|uniref:DUF4255 domain-containing protein n=1 Tax=Sphingomonas sp. BGYR3 TaxID=2975483 RepID=UPI0021A2829C|nr:DUF4255 domain-containing protein [Sphingomonas sp. BGYR3]MDG5489444.1 DUF4255 domain-containing protein [Sphingomonas sp. BGYR3]
MTAGIAAATLALADLARAAVPGADVRIGPPGPAAGETLSVALWLVQVEPDASSTNRRRPDGPAADRPASLLTARYLIAVAGTDGAETHRALGALAAALGNGAGVAGKGPPLRFSIDPLPLDSCAALWATLGPLPMQPWLALSVRGIAAA